MKKFLSLVISLCVMLSLTAPAVLAEEASLVVSGYWGESPNPDLHLRGVGNTNPDTMPEGITNPFIWKLYSDGVLEFVPVGDSQTVTWIDSNDQTPWYPYYSQIKKVVFGEGVKSVGANIFAQSFVEEVVFPESCTSIGSAFSWVRTLKKLNIPKNLQNLAETAFAQAGFSSISLPQTLTSVEKYTFLQASSLASATINGSEIKQDAFNNCHTLTTLKLYGDSVLKEGAMNNCINLNKIVAGPDVVIEDGAFVEGNKMSDGEIYGVKGSPAETFAKKNNIKFVEFDGIGTSGETAWEVVDTVLTISGDGAMADYEQKSAPWYSLSDKIRTIVVENGVTEIGDNAFSGLSNVKNTIISEGVTAIGANAFSGCGKLSAVILPDSVTTVEAGAFGEATAACVSKTSSFANADGFKTYTAGAAGDAVINESGKQNITWAVYGGDTLVFSGTGSMVNNYSGDNISNLPWKAYSEELKTVVVDYGITMVIQGLLTSDGGNSYPKVEAVIIADGVTQLRNNEVAGCTNLKRYDSSNKLEDIEHWVMSGTGIEELYLPGTLKKRSANVNFGSLGSLKTLILDEGFDALKDDVSGEWFSFIRDAGELKSITLPQSVTKVGSYSFSRISNLERLEFLNPNTVISENAFYECGNNITVVCTKDSNVETWANAQLEAGKIKAVETYVGKGSINKNLTWFVSGNGELKISGTGAMDDYTSAADAPWANVASKITSINVEAGVTSIGAYAFANLSNVTEAKIGKNVATVGEKAFDGHSEDFGIICESDAVKAYADANSIKVIVGGILSNNKVSWKIVGDTLTISGEGEIPGSSEPWNSTENETPWVNVAAFQNDINKIVIEEGITTIPAVAFASCFGLKTVSLPDSITSIGNLAFHRSVNLEFLELPANGTYYDAVAHPGDLKRTVIKSKTYNRIDNLSGDSNSSLGDFTVYCYADSAAYTQATQLGLKVETIKAEGKEGTIEWIVTNDGTLDIYGIGDLSSLTTAPWANYASEIENVYIEEGISGLGANLFAGINGAYIELPDEITSLSQNAITATNSTVRVPVYVETIAEGAFDTTTTIWSYKNSKALAYAKANSLTYDERESLRILALGNSFTQDSTAYLWNIADACGAEDVIVGRMFHAGARLYEHLRAANNEEGYEDFYLYTEQTSPNGEYAKDKTSFEYGVTARDWDVIVLQAWYPEACYGLNGGIENGEVVSKEWLNELTSIIKAKATNTDVELGFNMIWSQERQLSESVPNDSENNFNNRFNYGYTVADWESIVSQTETYIENNSDYTYLIPVGTAIENARTSYLAGIRGATSAADLMGGLQRDSVHLNDIGKYIAAMTWAKILKPEWQVENITFAPGVTYSGTTQRVIDEHIQKVAKESVQNAITDWKTITSSDYAYRIMNYENGNVTVAVSNVARNALGEDKSVGAKMIFAEYTQDGQLVKALPIDVTLTYDEVINDESTELHNEYKNNIFSDNGFSVADGNVVKVMLWNNLTGLNPLCDAFIR